MSVRVLEPGLQSLLVDSGRLHSRSLGVPVGGAADCWSLALGNALVGNPPNTPALEITLAGPVLQAEKDIGAIVFGAPFEIFDDRRPVQPNSSFTLRSGESLRLRGCTQGMRAYLCVSGGFGMEEVLGSRSAMMPVQSGQILLCSTSVQPHRWVLPFALLSIPAGMPQILRFLPGAQSSWFDLPAFCAQSFMVSPDSNRMGVRLQGIPLARPHREMVSEPVCPGSVQVTNDGQCIILGVDGQTIGGYPKIAQIVSADLDYLGQLRPGDTLCFAEVSLQQAEVAFSKRLAALHTWLVRIGTTLNCPGIWQSQSL